MKLDKIYMQTKLCAKIDIDSCVIDVEGHQNSTSKGYNPQKNSNRYYNIQFVFYEELKAYVTGLVRSGNTTMTKGEAERIKEILVNIKTDDLEVLFRMDSGCFDEKIIEMIESLEGQCLIKGENCSTLTSQAKKSSEEFVEIEEHREATELFTKLDKWEEIRKKECKYHFYKAPNTNNFSI